MEQLSVFAQYNEDNPCFGCPALCCQNTLIKLHSSGTLEKTAGVLYSDLINPKQHYSPSEILHKPPGVYWVIDKRGHQYIALRGPCPHLDLTTRRCTAHKKPRPHGCGLTDPRNPITKTIHCPP